MSGPKTQESTRLALTELLKDQPPATVGQTLKFSLDFKKIEQVLNGFYTAVLILYNFISFKLFKLFNLYCLKIYLWGARLAQPEEGARLLISGL